jgi:hypothetical protein
LPILLGLEKFNLFQARSLALIPSRACMQREITEGSQRDSSILTITLQCRTKRKSAAENLILFERMLAFRILGLLQVFRDTSQKTVKLPMFTSCDNSKSCSVHFILILKFLTCQLNRFSVLFREMLASTHLKNWYPSSMFPETLVF